MAVSLHHVNVPDRAALESTISSYIAQGFSVQNRGEAFATLFKKKEFSVLWAVVGLVLCVAPLLIYLIVYATQRDQMVEVRVGGPASRSIPSWSPDGRYWLQDDTWIDSHERLPESVQVSGDRHHLWDGRQWRSAADIPEPVLAQARVYGDVATAPPA